jgi:hypothetical protein
MQQDFTNKLYLFFACQHERSVAVVCSLVPLDYTAMVYAERLERNCVHFLLYVAFTEEKVRRPHQAQYASSDEEAKQRLTTRSISSVLRTGTHSP